MKNKTDVKCGTGSAFPTGIPDIIQRFRLGSCRSFFVFVCVMFCELSVCFFLFLAMVLSVDFELENFFIPLVPFASLNI